MWGSGGECFWLWAPGSPCFKCHLSTLRVPDRKLCLAKGLVVRVDRSAVLCFCGRVCLQNDDFNKPFVTFIDLKLVRSNSNRS